MARTADAVIIGAGIMGCSIAYYLASRGVKDIVVLEQDQIARGATADAAGGIRLQFSTETNIRLAQVSLEVWEHFPELFGTEIGLRQQGYLFLLTTDDEVKTFRANAALQESLGVPVRWLDPAEIGALNPAVRVDDVLGATFCPRDGWADPYSATTGIARAARQLGVEIREETAATGFVIEGGRVRGVRAGDEVISTPLAIICAGPHSRGVGELAGVDIPILPYRRMSFITEPFDAVPATVPMTIEFRSGLYFHPESHGFLFGMANPDDPPGFNKTVDDEWMMRTVEALCARAPAFEEARVMRGWAGFYEITPDDNPLLGWIDEVEGLAVAAGFSGHGFMQGPAVGMCMAELITEGRATTVDISAFAPSRFREGRLAQEHNVI
ncbi:NAD(P)/FAD-dependent oxidoreductase [Sphaerobacter thermophilus]|uniref:FAD dependent oxidoreductase n=1 Tax=Sphaerobacter thermophilus (strain ATCC 49802 / DSM 20745 / KCCM 41009 / NCIMB 13125 / S 6022) TaxID=479434 RepID=D1C2R8_SPHTD|nr:FAD-binding oxidoreductase [Sphaerobacter thermophilus]ACZ38535.1 FAD dependent oxidoreductase [Sphaerobacter thermophilus DSM 20745]